MNALQFAEYLKLADAINDKMDDGKPVMSEVRQNADDAAKVEPAAGEQNPTSEKTSMQDVRETSAEDLAALAEELAGRLILGGPLALHIVDMPFFIC